jgi:hypothetical protein
MADTMDSPEYDVDAIVDRVADAVAAGKYHEASADEVLLVRLSAFEDFVHMFKEIVTRHMSVA